MTGRRAIGGLCLLCALVFSAFAAQSASAAIAGTTAFTCKKNPTGMDLETVVGTPFNKEHCKEADKSVSGEYRHVSIPENTETTITGTNTETEGLHVSTTLKATFSGINVEITSNNVHGHGTMSNKKTVGGEHYIHGTGVIEYTEVMVKPAGLGCKVKGGKIVTEELTATSQGQGHKLKFSPAGATPFTTFEFEGCTEAALNKKYEVTGSLITEEIDGATVVAGHSAITTQNTLKLGGAKAGLSGVLTISGTDAAAGDTTFTPLSATTVET